MKFMKYKVYTENAQGEDEKIATTTNRHDADAILLNYAYGYIRFGEKVIFRKGMRS